MVDGTKMTTISVRVEDELMRLVDKVADIISINKSDFLRACLEKLAKDNKMLIDHCDKVPEYLAFIKSELSKLPEEMVEVRNGSWAEVRDFAILIVCDELWRTSEAVSQNWQLFATKYDLVRRDEPQTSNETEEEEESHGLLSLADLMFHFAEKSGPVPQVDIPALLRGDNWIDDVEADKISLLYAVKKAFEEHPARNIIRKHLEKAAEAEEMEWPVRLVIDAKGVFRRSGSVLYLPVFVEEIEKADSSQ